MADAIQPVHSQNTVRSPEGVQLSQNIQVPFEAVSDGLRKEGGGFRNAIGSLIHDGFKIDIELPNGAGSKTFQEVEDFEAWFDSLAV